MGVELRDDRMCFVCGSENPIGLHLPFTLDGDDCVIEFAPAKVHAQAFRNTYCAVRMQTLDGGAPVSVYTVARELGHSSTSMVERIYGHVGEVRHRAEVVEYRVEDFEEKLRDRLAGLPSG